VNEEGAVEIALGDHCSEGKMIYRFAVIYTSHDDRFLVPCAQGKINGAR